MKKPESKRAALVVRTSAEHTELRHADSGARYRLGPLASAVWTLADGSRTIPELAAGLRDRGHDVDEARIWSLLDGLADARLLEARVAPPAGGADPEIMRLDAPPPLISRRVLVGAGLAAASAGIAATLTSDASAYSEQECKTAAEQVGKTSEQVAKGGTASAEQQKYAAQAQQCATDAEQQSKTPEEQAKNAAQEQQSKTAAAQEQQSKTAAQEQQSKIPAGTAPTPEQEQASKAQEQQGKAQEQQVKVNYQAQEQQSKVAQEQQGKTAGIVEYPGRTSAVAGLISGPSGAMLTLAEAKLQCIGMPYCQGFVTCLPGGMTNDAGAQFPSYHDASTGKAKTWFYSTLLDRPLVSPEAGLTTYAVPTRITPALLGPFVRNAGAGHVLAPGMPVGGMYTLAEAKLLCAQNGACRGFTMASITSGYTAPDGTRYPTYGDGVRGKTWFFSLLNLVPISGQEAGVTAWQKSSLYAYPNYNAGPGHVLVPGLPSGTMMTLASAKAACTLNSDCKGFNIADVNGGYTAADGTRYPAYGDPATGKAMVWFLQVVSKVPISGQEAGVTVWEKKT